MSNLYRGSPIDVSYQFATHLAKRFRGEEFKKSANQKQESPVAAMFVNGSGRNEQSLEDHPWMLPTQFRIIWQSGTRGEDFRNRPIRNKNCL